MTQDTYRGQLSDPATLHRYGYVRNNPINLIDRYGFSHEQFTQQYSTKWPGSIDAYVAEVERLHLTHPAYAKAKEREQRLATVEKLTEMPLSEVSAMVALTAGTAGLSPSDQCASILNKIMKVATEIGGRQQDLLVDQHNLFKNYRWESNPHPQHGSYQGHQRQMEEQQGRLEKLKDRYNKMGCPDPPEGLPNAELLPVPLNPERATQQMTPNISPTEVVVGGAATIGVGYLIYRGVRLIPSLFPPAWPTLAPNLVIP